MSTCLREIAFIGGKLLICANVDNVLDGDKGHLVTFSETTGDNNFYVIEKLSGELFFIPSCFIMEAPETHYCL